MSEQLIPPIMHFIWLGKPMPAGLSRNVELWRSLHPEWKVNLWTEREIDEIGLRNRGLYDNAKRIVPADAVGQFQADIARYEILSLFGGFYADVDTRPLRSIEPALRGHETFAAMEDATWIGNTYLGGIPGHGVFRALTENLPGNVDRYRGRRPNQLSGPKFLTPVWKAFRGYTAPSHQWYPYSYSHVRRDTVPKSFGDDVYAVHQWNHTRAVIRSRSERR